MPCPRLPQFKGFVAYLGAQTSFLNQSSGFAKRAIFDAVKLTNNPLILWRELACRLDSRYVLSIKGAVCLQSGYLVIRRSRSQLFSVTMPRLDPSEVIISPVTEEDLPSIVSSPF